MQSHYRFLFCCYSLFLKELFGIDNIIKKDTNFLSVNYQKQIQSQRNKPTVIYNTNNNIQKNIDMYLYLNSVRNPENKIANNSYNIGNNSRIKSDSAIALISSSALAIGVAVTSLTTGMNTDVCNFMFGSILAMSIPDVILSVIVSIIVAILFIVYYRKLFIITFDEEFAKANGLKVKRYTNLIALLTALVIVVGMRMMGTMLISSIIIFPALTAMRLCKSFKKVVVTSAIISVVCFLVGIYFSYVYNISAGAMIVIVNLILFILFTLIDKIIHE
jgi:ABC-type Mn2+/Zn2+ transport system permease subunit